MGQPLRGTSLDPLLFEGNGSILTSLRGGLKKAIGGPLGGFSGHRHGDAVKSITKNHSLVRMSTTEYPGVSPSGAGDVPDRRHLIELEDHFSAERVRLASFKVGYACLTWAIVAATVGVVVPAPARPLVYGIALTLVIVGTLALLAWRLL